MMPLIGWLSGRYILVWAETWGSWIAFGLLLFIGARMLGNLVGAVMAGQLAESHRYPAMYRACAVTSAAALVVYAATAWRKTG